MTETTGEATIEIAASPDRVWGILTDLSRVGEMSPECYRAEWVSGSSGPEVGATFHGYNRAGPNEWDVPCTVIAAEPGREWAFQVPSQDGTLTTWRYVIDATEAGCRVTESYDSPILVQDYFTQMDPPRDQQLPVNIAESLENLKAMSEA